MMIDFVCRMLMMPMKNRRIGDLNKINYGNFRTEFKAGVANFSALFTKC